MDEILREGNEMQTEEKTDVTEKKVYTAQWNLMNLSRTYFTKVFAQASHYGIHPGQIPLLVILGKNNGISQRELADKLGIKPSTVTISIHRLEKNDLVECRPDENDRRRSRLYLSEKGKHFREKMAQVMEMNERFMMRGFSKSEVELLEHFLERIIHNMEAIPETLSGSSQKKADEEAD